MVKINTYIHFLFTNNRQIKSNTNIITLYNMQELLQTKFRDSKPCHNNTIILLYVLSEEAQVEFEFK